MLAAERLNTRAQSSWYVGDSTWDMRAAVAAQMVAIGVAYGAATDEDLVSAGADAVTTLADLESDLTERGLLRS